jgi:hypothetical protein
MNLVSAETSSEVFETLERAEKEFASFDFSTIS